MANRRSFIKYLTSSPLFAMSLTGCTPDQNDSYIHNKSNHRISDPKDALNVFDFKTMAQEELSAEHYGYINTGVDDNLTLHANREWFSHIQLRVRRLVDVSKIDTSTTIFGVNWESPIILAPCGSQKAFHPDGELAVARAARNNKSLQILSTVSTTSIEDVTAARGEPVWFQLYPAKDWQVTMAMIRRAEASGSPVLVLTVDMMSGSNRETARYSGKLNDGWHKFCGICHDEYHTNKPMIRGLDFQYSGSLTWEFVRKLKASTNMKIVLKGIVTSEDALLCILNGVDGIIVSNHGGRAEESGRATIECLPEVISAIRGQIPVLIDGGFRRGTDIFKALALGANGICIGRPYLWGLASFGQEGVEAVLEILHSELKLTMKQAGTVSIDQIDNNYISVHSDN